MQGRFSAQENNVALFIWRGKHFEPFFYRLPGECLAAMQDWVDIAMTAGEIAGCQDMKENIALSGLEGDCAGNVVHGISLGKMA